MCVILLERLHLFIWNNNIPKLIYDDFNQVWLVPYPEIYLPYQHNLLIREKMFFTKMMLIFVPQYATAFMLLELSESWSCFK